MRVGFAVQVNEGLERGGYGKNKHSRWEKEKLAEESVSILSVFASIDE
jgi:hypothetical protein